MNRADRTNFIIFIATWTPVVVWVLMLSGCTSLGPLLDPDLKYKKELNMQVFYISGGQWQDAGVKNGVGVLPLSPQYKIKLEKRAHRVIIFSCNYEWALTNVKEFNIWPNIANRNCPFNIEVYDQNGQHSWGLLIIKDLRADLGVHSICNGRSAPLGGTSICQSRYGLRQSLSFDRRVLATETPGCTLEKPKDQRNWLFLMPKDECIVYFVDEGNADLFHKAVLFGYEALAIRGN